MRRALLILTTLIIALLLIDAISGGGIRHPVRTLAARIWQGIEAVRGTVAESGFFSSRRVLARENAALRQELALSREDAAAYAVLRVENRELRAHLSLSEREGGAPAPIVSSVISSPYGTFLIGIGAASVREGDLALTADGFVVGTVSDPGERVSTVRESLAPGSTLEALIGASPARVEGRGGGNARASLPRAATVTVGDAVTVPAYGGRAVGVVGAVESSPAAADQTVYIHLPISLGALRYVLVSTP